MAEYALAVVKDRPQFHISLICDVSPNCDCHAEKMHQLYLMLGC